jgi:hypothetical protein
MSKSPSTRRNTRTIFSSEHSNSDFNPIAFQLRLEVQQDFRTPLLPLYFHRLWRSMPLLQL